MIGIGIGLGIGFGGAKGNTTPPVPVPVNSVAPVVSGNTLVGSVLSCTTGTWSNSPTGYTYQWRKGGVNIGGQTANTYTSVVGDVGAAIDCVVTASNAGGAGTPVDSNDVVVTAAPAFAFANLAALFNGGAVDGIMIDLTNKDTLFQDANGALPVSANNDPVGLALDQHKWGGLTLAAYRAAQAELMTNGDFAAGISGWTQLGSYSALTWDAANQRLVVTANSGNTPTVGGPTITGLSVGRWYELSVDIVSATGSGNFQLYVGTSVGSGAMLNNNTASVGSYRRFFKATATSAVVSVGCRAGSGVVTTIDNISVKEIDGHHATQTSTARPLWQSATSDVLFDGTNDYLTTTNFYFQDYNNHMAAWTTFGASPSVALMGVTLYAPTEYAYNYVNGSGMFSGYAGGNSPLVVGPNVLNSTRTTLVDQRLADVQIIIDGGAPASGASPGPMPDAVRAKPLFIGCVNDNGSPIMYFSGRIKRIVAGQVRVQDTMSAADFHSNLIAA